MLTDDEIPLTGLRQLIIDFAHRHGVVYVRTGNDASDDMITSLSDDVEPDETADLVVALRRANVINGREMLTLLGRYLEVKHNVVQ